MCLDGVCRDVWQICGTYLGMGNGVCEADTVNCWVLAVVGAGI